MADISLLVHQIADNANRPFDTMFKNRVERIIVGAWATLNRRDYDRYGRFSSNVIYELNPIETELVDSNPTINTRSFAKKTSLRRTKIQIPKPLKTRNESSYLYVGNVNRTEPYSYATIEEFDFITRGTRFAKDQIHYFELERYIYILGGKPKSISIRYVPSDPFELLKLKNTGVNCVDGFDIDETMEEAIKLIAYRELGISTSEDREVQINERER